MAAKNIAMYDYLSMYILLPLLIKFDIYNKWAIIYLNNVG